METELRRYRVIEAVGRGGFGTVYRAELLGPRGFRKEVALKVLNPDAPEAAGVAERLRDEARVLGMLRHRAIVQVDGLHLLGGRWTVVMEFVEGVDLKQLLAAQGKVPPGVALEIVQEVANALHYAYELSMDRSTSGVSPGSLRLLHRDIKPGNIQLTAAGEVKVLDFGVARADFADREAHTQSVYFGSLNYMSPERLDGIDDHKGDIYALGAMLYELVMGEPLGRTSASRERHDARLREALGKLWEELPSEDLYRLIAECLLYDPEARPTARELERACRTLRPAFGAPWLTEWAEEVVLGLLQTREPIDDDLSGATLVEQSGVSGGVTDSVAEDARPEGRRRRPRLGDRRRVIAAAAGTALVVVLVGGAVIGRVMWPQDGARREAATAGRDEGRRADALDELGEAFGDEGAGRTPGADAAGTPPAEPAEPWFMQGVDDAEPGDADVVGAEPVAGASTADERGGAPAEIGDEGSSHAAASTSAVQRGPSTSSAASAEAAEPEAPARETGAASATAAAGHGAPTSSPGPAVPAEPAAGSSSARPAVDDAGRATGAKQTTRSSSTAAATGSASTGAGTVRLLRGAPGLKVVLVGDGGAHHPPGRLPAGRYTVRATFPDGVVNDSLVIDIRDGAVVTLSCNVGLERCVEL